MKTRRPSLLSTTLPICLGLTLAMQAASAEPIDLSQTGRAILQAYRSNMNDCDPDETPDAERFDTCQRVVKSQRKRLARIKGHDRKHVTFREMSAYQARLEKANKRWRADKEQKRDDNRKRNELSSSFERELNDNGSILWFLSDLAQNKSRLGIADVDPHAVAKHLEAASALDSLATHCATRYAPILKSDKLLNRITADRAPKPNDSCELAKKSQKLLRRWFPRAVKAHVKRIETILKKEVKDIRETGKASNTILSAFKKSTMQSRIEQDLKAYSPSAKALGVKLSANVFSPWLKAVKSAPQAIAKAGKTRRRPPKSGNASITKAAKRRLKGTVLRFRKVGLVSKRGKIKKNYAGVPLRQVWRGELLAKKKGESFCRLYDFEASAEYRGDGRYQPPVAKLRGRGFHIAACR